MSRITVIFKEKKVWMNMLCMSLFVCFMICVFAPLEIYFAQKEEFFFGGSDIVPFAGLFFVVAFVATIIGLFVIGIISFKASQIIAIIVTFIGLTLYIQGNYIVAD